MLDTLEASAQRAAPDVDHWAVRGIVEDSQAARRSAKRCAGTEPQPRCRRDGHRVRSRRHRLRGHQRPERGRPRRGVRSSARSLAHADRGPQRVRRVARAPARPSGRYASRVEQPIASLKERYDVLADASAATRHRRAHRRLDRELVDGDDGSSSTSRATAARAEQQWSFVVPADRGHRARPRRDADPLVRRPVQRLLPARRPGGAGARVVR